MLLNTTAAEDFVDNHPNLTAEQVIPLARQQYQAWLDDAYEDQNVDIPPLQKWGAVMDDFIRDTIAKRQQS